MEVFQWGTYHDGFIHFNLSQFITEAQTKGQLAGLTGMTGHVGFEEADIPLPKNSIELSVKTGIPLLYFTLVHSPNASSPMIVKEKIPTIL
jgi:hypothetical protein